jgi:hypothetical protein
MSGEISRARGFGSVEHHGQRAERDVADQEQRENGTG